MSERTLRLCLRVGMHQIVFVPQVVALAITDVLAGTAIGWPSDIVDATDGSLVCALTSHAGYEEGMYCEVTFDLGEREADAVEDAVGARVAAWEAALAGKGRLPGLAPVLSDYAEALYGMGDEVDLTYPNGRPYARGLFLGIDVFGRATVRLAGGRELEFPPEQYRISF